MLRFTDGFDHYAPVAATAANITAYLQAGGYVVNNATNNTFNIVNGTDQGSLALKMTIQAASNTPPSMSRTVNSSAPLVVFGFGFRGTIGRLRFCRINDLDVDWDSATGKIRVGQALGNDVIIMGAWWYIEVEFDKTANEVRIWANNTLQLTVALPAATANTYAITWGIPQVSPSAAVMEIDDFYVLDSAGGQNNARVGPVAVVTRGPTADVVAQWATVGLQTPDHWRIAAQAEPGAAGAPYLQANVEGRTDKFTSNTVLPNDNKIFGVSVVAYSRKGDLDNRKLGMTMGTTGGSLETQVDLTEGFRFQQAVFEQAPGGQEWNRSRVEGSEFGIVAR